MTDHINGYVDPANGVSFHGWTKDEVKLFLQTIGRFVGAQVKPLQEEITALKAQIAELQENGVRYCGVYQRALTYKRGDQVTFDGARHTALRDIRPCEAPLKSDGWQLSDKSAERRLPTKNGARPQTVVEKRP